jgi:hypothetical protein
MPTPHEYGNGQHAENRLTALQNLVNHHKKLTLSFLSPFSCFDHKQSSRDTIPACFNFICKAVGSPSAICSVFLENNW